MSKRGWTFAAICAVSALALGAYIYRAAVTSRSAAGLTSDSEAAPIPMAAHDPPHKIFFRYNGVDQHYGHLAYIESGGPSELHFIDALSCEVVNVAAGRGICLSARRGVVTRYSAQLFDANTLQLLATIPLQGVPSRSRVSADGKLAALTVFVTGHGYASLDFSTQTLLVDTSDGRVLADLETFAVTRDGQPFSAVDFNFWGVTFTPDGQHFYATLSSNQRHYLIKADIAARSATVIHDNVECPSLSPDARRIAYKKRSIVDGRITWQLHILDLDSGRETPLAERRSIDDQLEWLNNEDVLYAMPEGGGTVSSPSTEVWIASTVQDRAPRLFLRKAYSPSVVR